MSDQPRDDSEDEFRDMLRAFLSGNSEIDPSKLASAAGLPSDPAAVQQLMAQLQNAMQASADGVNWDAARTQAEQIAGTASLAVTDQTRAALDQALHVATLWSPRSRTPRSPRACSPAPSGRRPRSRCGPSSPSPWP